MTVEPGMAISVEFEIIADLYLPESSPRVKLYSFEKQEWDFVSETSQIVSQLKAIDLADRR